MIVNFVPLTAFTLASGNNTAYVNPDGSAAVVKYLTITTNISATAGSYSAKVMLGSLALIPFTGITGGGMYPHNNAFGVSGNGQTVIVVANSGSGLDLTMHGLIIA